MARRGKLIGRGKVPGFGIVHIYQDLDNTNYVFVTHISTDEEKYLNRNRVYFIRQPRSDSASSHLDAGQAGDPASAVAAGDLGDVQIDRWSQLVGFEEALDVPADDAHAPADAVRLW